MSRLGVFLIFVTLALGCARRVPLDPAHPRFTAAAPDSFDVEMVTTKGTIIVRVRRHWSPNGADRFHALRVDGMRGYFT